MIPLLFLQPRLERLERGARQHAENHFRAEAFEPRPQPVTRCIQDDGAAGAEMRPEHSPFEASGRCAIDAYCHRGGMRDTGETSVNRVGQQERHQGRRRLDVTVTKRARESVAGSIASRFRKRAAACRKDDDRRLIVITVYRVDDELTLDPLNARDAAGYVQLGA